VSAVPLLEVKNVSKVFGGIKALNGVSFSIEAGQIVGLIGPNGSGKSTVINIISRLHRPTAGAVILEGRPITDLAPDRIARAGIARTFQLLRLFQGLTVFDNVLTATHMSGTHGLIGAIVGPLLTGSEEKRMRDKAQAALDLVGLARRAYVLAQRLTAGEGRLLELARAVATDPKLILLDEPAAGLNTAETDALEDTLRKVQQRGSALLLVDHHMRLVMRLADRVVVLKEGSLLAEGSPSQVQTDRRVIEAYLGSGALQQKRARP
jgi:ABC-type branched-subunit amino acid transport system ATPase component